MVLEARAVGDRSLDRGLIIRRDQCLLVSLVILVRPIGHAIPFLTSDPWPVVPVHVPSARSRSPHRSILMPAGIHDVFYLGWNDEERKTEMENARGMAAHASTKTTQLYGRRQDQVSLDEIERIVI